VDAALDQFRRMHKTTHALVEEMKKDAGAVAVDVSAAVRQLQFQDRVNQRLAHVVEDLAAVKERLEPHCEGVEVDSSEVLRQFAAHYTMSEERNVLGSAEHMQAGEVELF